MQDQIGYDDIIEKAMRSVIRASLQKVQKTGLPGKHYFVITFATRFPETVISKKLLEKYPEEMTIVMQHQYRGLVVEDDYFEVSLSFVGKYEKLHVPYKAITSFSDPSMNFALKFSMNYSEFEHPEDVDFGESNRANKNLNTDKKSAGVDLSAKVISLDAFRKNKDSNSAE
jgi:hypothetical protein